MSTPTLSYRDLVRLDLRTLSPLCNHRFTVIDFETNGGMGDRLEVTEFAAVRVRDGELDLRVSELCGVSAPLPPFIRRLTGITDEMLAGKPFFDDYLDFFLDFAGDDILVAHNAPFDIGILLHYMRQREERFAPKVVCTLTSARRLFPGQESYKLAALVDTFQLSDDARYHRALADAEATARLLLHMGTCAT